MCPSKRARGSAKRSQLRGQTITKSLESLPTSILSTIIVEISHLDRFRLKLAGNHAISDCVASLARPTFAEYLQSLHSCTSKTYPTITGSEKVFIIACEEGYDALVRKLEEGNSTVGNWERPLVAAIMYRQSSVIPIILRMIPVSPLSELDLRHPTRWNAYKPWVVEHALRYAAGYSDERIIQMLLNERSWSQSLGVVSVIEGAYRMARSIAVAAYLPRDRRVDHDKLAEPLMVAAANGREPIVRLLIKKGAILPQQGRRAHAIHVACKKGYKNILNILLAKGDIDSYVESGVQMISIHRDNGRRGYDYLNWSCLHFAIYGNQYEMVKHLLETGLSPGVGKQHRATALPLAALYGRNDIVRLLLQTGFDVSAELMGNTAMDLAARAGNLEIMTELRNHGASASGSALLLASSCGSIEAVVFLVKHGADLESTCEAHKHTALHHAVAAGKAGTVQLLLESGANINSMSMYGSTPLTMSIRKNFCKIATILLENGARLASEPARKTGGRAFCGGIPAVLLCAIKNKRATFIPLLVKYGADIEGELDDKRRRPLHQAAEDGDVATVKAILASKADVLSRDDGEMTALHWACAGGHGPVALELLRHGADVHAYDALGMTPLHLAARGHKPDARLRLRAEAAAFGHPEATEVVLSWGADVNARTKSSQTALHLAAEGDVRVVSILLKWSADIHALDKEDQTPLHLAAMYADYDKVYKKLIAKGADPTRRNCRGETAGEIKAKWGYWPIWDPP